jgi:hypothetical protein
LADTANWEPGSGGVNVLHVAEASAGATSVRTMIAWRDVWARLGQPPDSEPDGNRFRLVFGMDDFSGQADGSLVPAGASESLKWIYRMDIDLSASAPAVSGGSGGGSDSDDAEDEDDADAAPNDGVSDSVITGADLAGEAFAHNLTDVSGHWAEAEIARMVRLGVISGNPDGSFAPNGRVTRAQFATMLVNTMVLKKLCYLDAGSVTLPDAERHWAREHLAAAVKYGVIKAQEDGSVNPEALITRQEMAVMLARALKLETEGKTAAFGDSGGIALWASGSVAALVENGGMSGFPDGTFHPGDAATKAQAVVSILRAFNNAGENL